MDSWLHHSVYRGFRCPQCRNEIELAVNHSNEGVRDFSIKCECFAIQRRGDPPFLTPQQWGELVMKSKKSAHGGLIEFREMCGGK